MFKGFQDTSRSPQFRGFPNLNFQMNNEAYGFSGVYARLSAKYGLMTQTDLAAVSSWKEIIGNRNFAQSTAGNQPRLVLADAAFNNLPVIDFQDTNRQLIIPDAAYIPLSSSMTIAMIVQMTTLNSRNTVFSDGNASPQDNLSLGGSAGGVTGIGIYNASTPVLVTTVEDTNPHIVIITSGSNAEIVVDGVSQVTGTWNPTTVYSRTGATTTNANIRGKLADAIFYGQSLSSLDMIELSTRINTEYAIY